MLQVYKIDYVAISLLPLLSIAAPRLNRARLPLLNIVGPRGRQPPLTCVSMATTTVLHLHYLFIVWIQLLLQELNGW